MISGALSPVPDRLMMKGLFPPSLLESEIAAVLLPTLVGVKVMVKLTLELGVTKSVLKLVDVVKSALLVPVIELPLNLSVSVPVFSMVNDFPLPALMMLVPKLKLPPLAIVVAFCLTPIIASEPAALRLISKGFSSGSLEVKLHFAVLLPLAPGVHRMVRL